MENRNPVPGGDEFRNPITVPRGTEPMPEEEDNSRAARLLGVCIREIARGMSRREVEALKKRVKHAQADDGRFRDWLGGFYNEQAERIDREIGPLCDALGVRQSDRIACVEEIVKESIRELLDGDAVQVVALWERGALCERYTRKLKGLAA